MNELLTDASNRLLDAALTAIASHAAYRAEQGDTFEQVTASVAAYCEDLKRWHREAVADIARIIANPRLPSHRLH